MANLATLRKAAAEFRRELDGYRASRSSNTFDNLARALDESVASAKQRIGRVQPDDRRTLIQADESFATELSKINYLVI